MAGRDKALIRECARGTGSRAFGNARQYEAYDR
jgi:hypothetical protein